MDEYVGRWRLGEAPNPRRLAWEHYMEVRRCGYLARGIWFEGVHDGVKGRVVGYVGYVGESCGCQWECECWEEWRSLVG